MDSSEQLLPESEQFIVCSQVSRTNTSILISIIYSFLTKVVVFKAFITRCRINGKELFYTLLMSENHLLVFLTFGVLNNFFQ